MDQHTKNGNAARSKRLHFGMVACCVIMLMPVAGFLLAGGGISDLGRNVGALAPLLIFVGAHFVMHKMIGKSCHGASENDLRTQAFPAQTDDQLAERLSLRG